MSKQTRMLAAQAYQVIGFLDGIENDLDSEQVSQAVTEALDYFGDVANGDLKPQNDFLPFPSGKYLRSNKAG